MQKYLRRFQVPDLGLFAVVFMLLGLGLVMVFSASSVLALEKFGDATFYLKRQTLFGVTGFLAMILIMNSDYHSWVKRGGWFLIFSILSLIFVLIPGLGYRAGGAQRWISLGGFQVQPGEYVKIALILYLSWALVKKGENAKTFLYGMLPMGIVSGLLSFLLLMQPDFGNAVILTSLGLILIFLAGVRINYLIGVIIGSLPMLYFLILGEDYRRRRLLAFLDPWQDPKNVSYQIVQSFTAFYSGGFWGNGLGNSQEKLYYLPEVQTDFIGAVVGEELGFLGILFLVACFGFLVYRGFQIAYSARDEQGFLLAAGCTSFIGLQAVLNLCVIMGLLPTKGLPLPFISHGGSALIAVFVCCGFIQSVANDRLKHGGTGTRIRTKISHEH